MTSKMLAMPLEVAHVPVIVAAPEPCPMLACATRTNPAAHSCNHFCEYVGRNEAMYAEEWRCACGYQTFFDSDESKMRAGEASR